VETRNITLSLPAHLIRQAKIYAAEHDTSVNSFVRELLQDALSRQGRFRAAADTVLSIADRGPYFTADPSSFRRDDIHERRPR
jgi:plasmid stability protein